VADVTIRYEPTGEELTLDETSVPGFVRPENPGWVVLDAAGRKKAHQPATTSTTEKKD
jgi:hypothetical protein